MGKPATKIPPCISKAPGPHGTTVYKIRIRHNGKLVRCGTYASIESARVTLLEIRELQRINQLNPAKYQTLRVEPPPSDKGELFADVVDKYLADQLHLAPSSRETYRTACTKIKAATVGLAWAEVTREVVKDLVLSVQAPDTLTKIRMDDDGDLFEETIEKIRKNDAALQGTRGRPKDTGGGVETLVNVLRNVYAYGVGNGYPPPSVDPLYKISQLIAERDSFIIKPYTTEDQDTYFENLSKEPGWFKAWSYLIFGTGARMGESLAFSEETLKFSQDEISIWWQYYKGKIRAPKYNSIRTMDMIDDVKEAILEWREQVRWERKFHGREAEKHHWILPSWKNSRNVPLSSSFVAKHYVQYLKRIGLPPRRVHDIRHTVGTQLIRNGVPVHVVKEILGHKDITTTFNLYVSVSSPEISKAMASLNRKPPVNCPRCKHPMP